jgi:hypothetical protein
MGASTGQEPLSLDINSLLPPKEPAKTRPLGISESLVKIVD